MRRVLAIAAVATLVLSTSASAQRRSSSSASSSSEMPIELGVDGGLSFGLGGTNSVTIFDLPVQSVRAGFFISPEISIEPSLGMTYATSSNVSGSAYNLGVGLLYHFSTSRAQNQLYVRPFLNLEGQSNKVNGTSNSATNTIFGAGVGVKLPATDRLSWRLEANIGHNSNNNFDNSDNRLGLLFGVSYFTH